MGLGILTKGPVGLLIPAGAYAAARIAAGEHRLLKKTHWLWGPLIALSLPAAWLGLVWWSGAPDGYFRELLFSQNLERAAGELGHRQPFQYFLKTLPLDLLPWTLCLPAAVLLAARDPSRWILLRRLAGWFAFVLVFFSIVSSKRNVYVLGAFPAVAILMGSVWPDLAAAQFRWARFARGAFMILLLAAGAGALGASFHPKLPIAGWTLWPAGLAALLGAYSLWRELRWVHPPIAFFPLATLTFLSVQWAVSLFVYPAANPLKIPGELARASAALLSPDRPLLLYQINGEILAYYAGRRGEVLWSPKALRTAMKRERSGIVAFDASDFAGWSASSAALPGTPHPFRLGTKRLVWLEYDLDQP